MRARQEDAPLDVRADVDAPLVAAGADKNGKCATRATEDDYLTGDIGSDPGYDTEYLFGSDPGTEYVSEDEDES